MKPTIFLLHGGAEACLMLLPHQKMKEVEVSFQKDAVDENALNFCFRKQLYFEIYLSRQIVEVGYHWFAATIVAGLIATPAVVLIETLRMWPFLTLMLQAEKVHSH